MKDIILFGGKYERALKPEPSENRPGRNSTFIFPYSRKFVEAGEREIRQQIYDCLAENTRGG